MGKRKKSTDTVELLNRGKKTAKLISRLAVLISYTLSNDKVYSIYNYNYRTIKKRNGYVAMVLLFALLLNSRDVALYVAIILISLMYLFIDNK